MFGAEKYLLALSDLVGDGRGDTNFGFGDQFSVEGVDGVYGIGDEVASRTSMFGIELCGGMVMVKYLSVGYWYDS